VKKSIELTSCSTFAGRFSSEEERLSRKDDTFFKEVVMIGCVKGGGLSTAEGAIITSKFYFSHRVYSFLGFCVTS